MSAPSEGLGEPAGTAYVDLHDLGCRAQGCGGAGSIAGQRANLVALCQQGGHQPAAEQPGAPGHRDHTGSPLAEPRFSISRVGIDSSAGSSKPSTCE